MFTAPVLDENGKVIMQHGQTSTQLLREDFKEHNFIFTQWKKMMHFNVLKSMKVRLPEPPETKSTEPTVASSRAMSPTGPGVRNQKDGEVVPEQNLSNQWRIYAKMEANYHLSNKFALFFHMSKYYRSIERDPFDVLPLTFHITKGTTDQVFYKFVSVFREQEEKHN